MAANISLISEKAKELGVAFEAIRDRPLAHGEKYLAHRNGPVKMLTCRNDDRVNGWVVPLEPGYFYDTHECFRIIE